MFLWKKKSQNTLKEKYVKPILKNNFFCQYVAICSFVCMHGIWATIFILEIHSAVTKYETTLLTCRPPSQIEAVSVVNFGASWSLTGNQLPTISTTETFILPLFHDFCLWLALSVPPLTFLRFLFCSRWLILKTEKKSGWRKKSLLSYK